MIGIGTKLLKAQGSSLFPIDFRDLPAGDMSQAAMLLAKGVHFTRASDGHTVQTSDATLLRDLAGNDRPRIAQRTSSSSSRGLALHEARQNNSYSRETGSGSAGSGVTRTADNTVGPAGELTPNRAALIAVSSGGYSNYYFGTAGCASMWIKGSARSVIGDGTCATTSIQSASSAGWSRHVLANSTAALASYAFVPLDARDWSGCGKAGASPQSCVIDWIQVEVIPGTLAQPWFATDCILSDSGTSGIRTRADEHADFPTGSSFVVAGRVDYYVQIIAAGQMSSLVTGYIGNTYLWADPNSTDAVWMDPDPSTGRKVHVKVGGVTQVLATTMTWSAYDVVEIYVGAGGGVGTTAAYRVNGGATVQLGTAAALGTIAPSGQLDLLCSGTTGQFSGDVQIIDRKKPSWA